jgi:hypothetical protein
MFEARKGFSGKEYGGAPGEIRTPGLLVRSQALYPTELQARNEKIDGDSSALRASFLRFRFGTAVASAPASPSSINQILNNLR